MYVDLHEVTWRGAWLYGVHRTCWDGSSFMWHQPCQHRKYTTLVDIQKHAIKSYSLMQNHIRAQELCESRGGRPGLPSLINLQFLWTLSNTQQQQRKITCECRESAWEQRIALYENDQQQLLPAKIGKALQKRPMASKPQLSSFAELQIFVRLYRNRKRSCKMVNCCRALQKVH